jgi:hypothetical protein
MIDGLVIGKMGANGGVNYRFVCHERGYAIRVCEQDFADSFLVPAGREIQTETTSIRVCSYRLKRGHMKRASKKKKAAPNPTG